MGVGGLRLRLVKSVTDLGRRSADSLRGGKMRISMELHNSPGTDEDFEPTVPPPEDDPPTPPPGS